MLPPRYYHVTERTDAEQILQEGFQGGWGDVGFGVYTYGSHYEALDYSAKGGWDGRLKDPVILLIEDDSLERVIPDPSWDASLYEQMYWKDLEDGDEDAFWMPQGLTILDLAPTTPALSVETAPEPAPASALSRPRRRP